MVFYIQISGGGLSGIAVADFQSEMHSYIGDSESVIACFKTVTSQVCNLSGGVGSLQNALDQLDSRTAQEEAQLAQCRAVEKQVSDFLELARQVDSRVAVDVSKNQEKFYEKYPQMEPVTETALEKWGREAWGWLCDTGEKIVDGLEAAWEWTKDTAKKAWNWAVDFYNEHKKIIDTILIVVGAIGAIAAVIFTGGAALVPLLTALGVSAGAATIISAAVAVVAVVSTVASSILNIVDTWCEIDNTSFNTWQKALNIVSGISNFAYSIGNIYNSLKHIDPTDYVVKNTPAPAKSVPASTFDDSVSIAQDSFKENNYFVKGDHYDEFSDFWESSLDGYSFTPSENSQVQYVRAKDIEGVFLNQNEVSDPSIFWNKRYTKVEYLDYARQGKIINDPVIVSKVNDSFYYFSGEGRHRIISSQILDIDIPVIINGFYTKI